MLRMSVAAAVVVGLSVAAAGAARAQAPTKPDWAQFRGPNATGIAAVTKAPPVEFGPDKNVVWKADIPIGHSSPVIWGDRLFLTAFDAGKERLLVLALDRKTGKELWRREIAYEKLGNMQAVSTPATATPVVDGERVYVYFAAAGLFAYDLDGAPAWTLPIPFSQTQFGSGTSPVLAGERLILNRAANEESFILAVDRRTGKELWRVTRTPPGGPSHSTPVIVGDQVVVHGFGKVESYELATGTLRWFVNVRTSGESTPAVVGDMIYVATWNGGGEADQVRTMPDWATLLKEHDADKSGTISEGEMKASGVTVLTRPDVPGVPGTSFGVPFMDQDKNGEMTADEWAFVLKQIEMLKTTPNPHGLLAIRTDGEGDVTATHVAWRENTAIPEVPSPLVVDRHVYYVRNGGILSCLDVASGKVLYRERVGAPGAYYASPIAAGGHVYLGSGDGVMTVLAPGDTMTVLARNDLGEPIYATPAVAPEGILYVRTTSALYAFGEQ
jgi:outer membrane protein assembly factor BamB